VHRDRVYVKLSRALYGTIEAAKIWYDTLSSKFRKEGFTQNAYDNCVFNKEYNNNQLTVLLHVDDLKIACIDMLNREYTKANVYEGSKLDYLGMIFNYGKLSMINVMSPLNIILYISSNLIVKLFDSTINIFLHFLW
jgi:hypothetical protein